MASAPAAFMVLQLPFLIGLLLVSESAVDAQQDYLLFVAMGLVVFTFGAIAVAERTHWRAEHEFRTRRQWLRPPGSRTQEKVLVALLILGLCAGVIFVAAIGYHPFLEVLADQDPFSPATTFRDLRAQATRSSYVAAGYVAQFTVVLMPLVLAWLALLPRSSQKPWISIAIGSVAIGELVFLTAAGGRRPLLDFIVVVTVLLATRLTFVDDPLLSRRSLVALAAAALLLFGVLTVLQGRISSDGSSAINQISEVSRSLFDRVSYQRAQNQLTAWEILRESSPQFGREWLNTLSIALPGPTQSQTLASFLHERMFGSADANAPLVIWGSLLYNWGWWIGLSIAGIWGAFLQFVTVRIARHSYSLPVAVAGQIILLRLALVADPYTLLLEGVITLGLVWAFLKGLEGRKPLQSAIDEIALARRP